MKVIKIALLFTMLCLVSPAVVAQDNTEATTIENKIELKEVTVDKLFDEMSEIKDASDMKISSFMLSMAKMFAPKEDQEFLKKVKSMRIILFSDCSSEGKKQFEQYVKSIKVKGFESDDDLREKIGDDSDEVENIKPFIKIKGETINEIIMADFNEKEPALIYINGKFLLSEMEELARGKNPILEDTKND